MNVSNSRWNDLVLKTKSEINNIPKPPTILKEKYITRLEYDSVGRGQKYNCKELTAILTVILCDKIVYYINGDVERPFRWQISVLDLPFEEVANIVNVLQLLAKGSNLSAQYDQLSRNDSTFLLDFEVVQLRDVGSIAKGDESKDVSSGSSKNKSSIGKTAP